MLMTPPDVAMDDSTPDGPADTARHILDLMFSVMSDDLDHPELWSLIPDFVASQPMLRPVLLAAFSVPCDPVTHRSILLLRALCGAAEGDVDQIIDALTPLAADHSQSPLVQGVMFHLGSLADPDNPKYVLTGKICENPFRQIDVLERSTHLCCASWLPTSAGDLSSSDWPDVWNSEPAQAIRTSIHDGSYRYCNKGACPKILSNALPPAAELVA